MDAMEVFTAAVDAETEAYFQWKSLDADRRAGGNIEWWQVDAAWAAYMEAGEKANALAVAAGHEPVEL